MKHTIKQTSKNTHVLKVYDDCEILCISDLHWDHPHCDRKLLKRHLDAAKEKGSPVLINGDFFCVMQTPHDRRSSKGSTRKEHENADYISSIVRDAVEWFKPYSDILFLVGLGNHETGLMKHTGFNIAQSFVDMMKYACPDSPICLSGYSGFLAIQCYKHNKNRNSAILYYHHGAGGNAPVTLGVLNTARNGAMVQGADFVWTGHVHKEWCVTRPIFRLNHKQSGVECKDVVYFSTAGYKDSFDSGYAGWEVEKNMGPATLGGAWITVEHRSPHRQHFVVFDVRRAK